MRIIKKGKKPEPEKEIEATCGNCGTEFAFKKSEARVNQTVGIEPPTRYTIACPLCKETVFLNYRYSLSGIGGFVVEETRNDLGYGKLPHHEDQGFSTIGYGKLK